MSLAADRSIDATHRQCPSILIGGADATLVSSGILLGLLAATCLYVYGWSPKYMGLVAAAVLLCSSLWLPPYMKLTGTLLFLSMLLSLYSAEAILCYLGPITWDDTPDFSHGLTWSRDLVDNRAEWAKSMGQPFDTRNRLQVIEDLEAHGIPAYPPIAGNVILGVNGERLLPLSGISNVMTVYCNESGPYTMYRSDEYGFHNPHGLWATPPADIMVVGDSFAHGACVPSQDNFVARIRATYPHTLNVGLGAIGPMQELAILKEYGPIARPRIVLWTYDESTDLADLSQPQDQLYRAYLSEDYSQDLVGHQSAIDEALIKNYRKVRREIAQNPEPPRATAVERFLKVTALRTRLRHVRLPLGMAPEESLSMFQHILREAARVSNLWGGRLIFVYLPAYSRYAGLRWGNPDRDRILSLVKHMGLPVIDLQPVFAAHRDPIALFPFARPGHYTVEGNRLIAEAILSALPHRPELLERDLDKRP